MSTKTGFRPGDAHEGCVYGDGVFVLRLRSQHVGETTRGVIGLPVHVLVVSHVTCDRCSAVYEARHKGQRLTSLCERQTAGFIGPPNKPEQCPNCPEARGQLSEVYLESFRDNFSRSATRHGVSCLFCLRCGKLAWKYEHSAKEYAQIEHDLANVFAVRK